MALTKINLRFARSYVIILRSIRSPHREVAILAQASEGVRRRPGGPQRFVNYYYIKTLLNYYDSKLLLLLLLCYYITILLLLLLYYNGFAPSGPRRGRPLRARGSIRGVRKGTNGVSTDGVTADFMFFDRGAFWVLPLTCFYLPKSARAYLFPNLSEFIPFAAAPLALIPFVRNQLLLL